MDIQGRAYRADEAERCCEAEQLRQERFGEPPVKKAPLEIRELPGSDCVAIRRGPGVDWSVVWLPRSFAAQMRQREDEESRRFRAMLNDRLAKDEAGEP